MCVVLTYREHGRRNRNRNCDHVLYRNRKFTGVHVYGGIYVHLRNRKYDRRNSGDGDDRVWNGNDNVRNRKHVDYDGDRDAVYWHRNFYCHR